MLIVKKMSAIILGSIIISFGVNVFILPYNILDGGLIGLGLILNFPPLFSTISPLFAAITWWTTSRNRRGHYVCI